MLLYIDPGTGSMFFSLAIGLLSILWFGFRKIFFGVKYKTIGKGKRNQKTIPFVIFSDDKRYWRFFEPVCKELDKRSFEMVYMTQSEDDPVFHTKLEHLHPQYIGSGNKAYSKMNFLNATMVLSTTPGLDVYQWKRSKDVQCYVFMPHGANAMTTLKMFGVEFFDVILTSGQYQVDILRELERKRKKPPKELFMIGIPYMDVIHERLKTSEHPINKETTVLIAPSWGKNSIFNRFGDRIIQLLSEAEYHIIIRPHPQSYTSEKELIDGIKNRWPESEKIEWNSDNDNFDVLTRADILISDFSGTIFEFALAFDKPVICVDTEFDDSQYDSYWLDTQNWSIATIPKLGEVLTEDNFDSINEMIERCLNGGQYSEKRKEVLREAWEYQGLGAIRTADYIEKKYKELVENND